MARLLLVDDHADLRSAVEQLLSMCGHEVTICSTGESALQAIAGEAPDAVIADQRLPGISGIELLRKIRQDSRLAGIPVVICSADESIRKEAERAGATEFWLKGTDAMFESLQLLGKELK